MSKYDKAVAVETPQPEPEVIHHPPDFRLFRLGRGERLRCGQYSDQGTCKSEHFTVHMSDSAVTLCCMHCGSEQVVIVNQVKE